VRQFSIAHDAALAVLVLGCMLAVWAPRRHPGRWVRWAALALAFVIFAGWAGEYVADAIEGIYSARYTLPLQLTDAVSATAILALLTRRQLLVELLYFWALSASLQAALTPDLAYTFPNWFYFTYFMYHDGSIVAAFLLVFGCRQYPRHGAIWWVFGFTLAWAAIAGLGDVITGGNYMYLASKPVHNSLLSVLGPWPVYIASAAGVALIMLAILAAIARVLERRDSVLGQAGRSEISPARPAHAGW
jgi:hypothetical integral membrane protein (TIGR02206 family)